MPLDVQVVADDSGTKGTGTHLVLGGLMAPAMTWALFADAWTECLHNSPRIEFFKLDHAAKRIGPFAGFSEGSRDEKLRALARVVSSFPFVAFTASINLADQKVRESQNEQGRKKKKFEKTIARVNATLRHPYYEAYMYLIMGATIHLWRDDGVRDRFEFIVDEHKSLGQRTADIYPAVRLMMPEDMRSIMPIAPISRDDREFVPLQAADMIAGLKRLEAEGKSRLHWLGAHLTSVRRSWHSVDADASWHANNRRLVQQHGLPSSTRDSYRELLKVVGPPVDPDDPILLDDFLAYMESQRT